MPSWWRSLLSGPGDEELGVPDLRRRVVDAITALAERDDQGHQVLPESLRITLSAPAERLELMRRFVAEPGFERSLDEALLNALYGTPRERLPLRRYSLQEGPEVQVSAVAEAPQALAWLQVRGGDRDGQSCPVPPLRRPFCIGRTEFHGGSNDECNDFVVSVEDRFVSRRAAALHREGARLFVEVRDQGDCLVLERADGSRLRPINTAGRRLEIQAGDRLRFTDGQSAAVEVLVLDHKPEPA